MIIIIYVAEHRNSINLHFYQKDNI